MVQQPGSNVRVKDKSEPSQPIKIAAFRKNVRKTHPHKHNNYFELIFLQAGSGSHTIDGVAYAVSPPVLFLIRREQVHHWDLSDEPEGYVLIIKKQFVDECVDEPLKNLFSVMSSWNCLYLTDTAAIDAVFRLLLASNQTGNRDVTEGLLKALLGLVREQLPGTSATSGQKQDTFHRFEELLRQTEELHNSVSYYARLLNTTPQNLNAICRKAAGEPAASVIASHLLGEAKRLLLYTNLTVGQTAMRLNFKDVSHFIKFFKRHTGSTPQAFRLQE